VRAPGSLWLKTARAGAGQGEHEVTPANASRILGPKGSLAGGANTYAIDWQPTHVAWCVGALGEGRRQARFFSSPGVLGLAAGGEPLDPSKTPPRP
jgi:hypothetical protein